MNEMTLLCVSKSYILSVFETSTLVISRTYIGFPRDSMDSHGIPKIPMGFQGFPRDSHGIPGIPTGFQRFQGFPRDSRDSRDSHGIPRIPMGFGIPGIRRFPLENCTMLTFEILS